jgi:hypothetical protein
MDALAETSSTDGQRRARLEELVRDRRERALTLAVLAVASAVAAALEPALAPFWIAASAIAVAASAAVLLAARRAGGEADTVLDAMLIGVVGTPGSAALARRARRNSSLRHRRRLARRLESLVDCAERNPRRECFQTGLVRLHSRRMCGIAAALRRESPPAASAVARVHRLLWDPASPLVRREADAVRFSAWLRQIEVDLGATRAAVPVPVSSRRAVARSQARSDRVRAALRGARQA